MWISSILITVQAGEMLYGLLLFHLVADGLESSGIVHSQIGENLAVDLDTGFVNQTHQLRVREILHAGSCVDTLNPECAEVALFLLAVAICVCQTLLPGVLGNCPDVAAATIVTTGEFQDFLSFGA